ncbi:MAG: DUF4145 domain-containing protein [Thermoprotei archaeon]|nr:MAG: DUF4145 domain-containing protein [Thermoprotei archaeon]
MSTEVLSVRIRRDLKEEVARLGINVREVVERALEEEVRRVRVEILKKAIERGLEAMDLSVDEWVRAVREARRGR